jgi:hypothetical protein
MIEWVDQLLHTFRGSDSVRRFAATAALAACLAPAIGRLNAQTWEVGGTGVVGGFSEADLGSVASNDREGEQTRVVGRRGFGLRLTRNTPGYYGHELGYIRSDAIVRSNVLVDGVRTQREDGVRVQQIFYNFLIYFMPAGERWRPFITGGLQTHQYGTPDITGWPGGGTRKYGVNYGGGLKLLLSRNALIRFDIRDYITGKPYNLFFAPGDIASNPFRGGGRLRQYEFSAGFSFAF